MFMNYLSKPIVLYTVVSIFSAILLSMVISLFLPNENFFEKSTQYNVSKSSFTLAQAFNLESKQLPGSKAQTVETTGEYLLRDFVLNGIFVDGKDSLVIIKNAQSGVFLHLNEKHQGYTLVEVFMKKAKFQKGIHFYWCFLDPKDETAFKESPNAPREGSIATSKVRKTIARAMFEDIKYKNGTYYIPKDMIAQYTDLSAIAGTAAARPYMHGAQIMFQITYLSSQSVLYRLGFRKGDFITQVNKSNFKSITEPLKYFQNMKNIKKLSITVERVNQKKELKYEVY